MDQAQQRVLLLVMLLGRSNVELSLRAESRQDGARADGAAGNEMFQDPRPEIENRMHQTRIFPSK